MSVKQIGTSDIRINNVVYEIERIFNSKKTVKEKIEEIIASKNTN